jgi:2',3'-cyclic-nucleotide 2'-phosphodiesterase (5'-nucleotidase family)
MVLLSVVCGSGAQDGASSGKLVILFTHDLHSYFLPQRLSSSSGPDRTEGGYAKLYTLIKGYQKRFKGQTLLVDGGDFSMGTLFHTAFMTDALELRLMGRMGYDATTLGNHDFDFRLDGLARSLMKARAMERRLPAIVASNVVFGPPCTEDASLRQAFAAYPVRPYIVLERNGLRIGLFGLLGKDAKTDAPFTAPVTFADPVATARALCETLRTREKVDLVVCLSHSGTSTDPKRSEDETLAREVPQIDVIVSGHTHTVLRKPRVIGKTIIVSCGSYGSYLGILELSHLPGQGTTWTAYNLSRISEPVLDDDELLKEITGYKATVERDYLGAYGIRFDQVIAESGYDMETVAQIYARKGETGIGNLIADAYRLAIEKAEGPSGDPVHLTIQPIGHIRSSFLKGKVTVDDIFRVLSLGLGTDGTPGYPLLTAYLTGAEIKKLLEVETTVSHLKDDAHLQISGMRCTYNPHRIPFDRVTSVEVQTRGGTYAPLDPTQLYRVGMNHYTAAMVDYVSRVSHGLLTIVPKDRTGRPLRTLHEAVVSLRGKDGSASADGGVTQIKEWAALTDFLRHFPDTDGNGIPDIPERYRGPEGRLVSLPSWNPVKLIAGGTAVTYGLLGLCLAALILVVLLVWTVRRLVRRHHQGVKKTI